MKLGIVGLSRSGKTTVFNALTQRTGESAAVSGQVVPVLGVVPVPDTRLEWLFSLYQPRKKTPAQVTYTDLQGIAGVAEKKKDYMALLLTHMRPVEAFLVVVRNFSDPALGLPHPARDLRELEEEFLLADLATVEKRLERIEAELKKGRKTAAVELELLQRCAELLNQEKPLRTEPSLATAPELKGYTFLSAKPILVVVNNDDDNPHVPEDLKGLEDVLVIRGRLEMEMAQLSEADAAVFREDYGITDSAMDRVIRRSFQLLGLGSFFTVGEDEVKAWTIPCGLPAVEAAGVVHSDMKKGFIRAEVVAYEDLRRAGDYAAARKQGLVRLEGRDYPVKDGDIVHFRFNV
ncbi:MAG: DUF933 domain-containing protein [Desulfosoma sp.]